MIDQHQVFDIGGTIAPDVESRWAAEIRGQWREIVRGDAATERALVMSDEPRDNTDHLDPSAIRIAELEAELAVALAEIDRLQQVAGAVTEGQSFSEIKEELKADDSQHG